MDVTKQNRDYKSLQPIAQQAYLLFVDECKKQGLDIFVTEFHRSQKRQDYLYEQGRTRPGQIVTWTKNSNHTSGYAWDIAVNPPKDLYDSTAINKAGEIAKKLGIDWGGAWKEKDTPHFQIDKNWKSPKGDGEVLKEIKINLDGEIKTVTTIEKDGNNYVKLQDIRCKNIVIDYDSKNKIPIVKVVK